MKIYLAPMEGLADHHLRKVLTSIGGYDLVVTEFVRVVDMLLPEHVFETRAPEIKQGCYTDDGTPVRIQLLGSDPAALAENARRAIALGSHGVDLNFGCPSKTVNKSKGGAVLLKEPELMFRIVQAVRDAVPADHTVSAKMRFGYESDTDAHACAKAIRDGGANEVTIHARTKVQGYKPPAFWHLVKGYQNSLGIPVIINGEIWNNNDAHAALRQSESDHLMIGRGAVANPWLAQSISQNTDLLPNWQDAVALIDRFWLDVVSTMAPRYCAGRLKQWLKHLSDHFPEATTLFQKLRSETDTEVIGAIIKRELDGK